MREFNQEKQTSERLSLRRKKETKLYLVWNNRKSPHATYIAHTHTQTKSKTMHSLELYI
jgi:hypothetical protein